MDRLQRMLGGMQGMGGGASPGTDAPQQDTSEQIYISSLALLKMLKHGRAGVPLEVIGLMLGEFVDEYTVKVRWHRRAGRAARERDVRPAQTL